MAKVFFVGDFVTDTGPGVANRMLRKGFGNNRDILYSDAQNRISRVIEMFIKICISECVCFCSPSRINVIGIRIAKRFHKGTSYLMHGYLTYENQLNRPECSGEDLQKTNEFERYIFRNVDKVFCVSEKFADFMKQAEPEFADKFDYSYNGLALDEIEKQASSNTRGKKPCRVVALGGGMRRKNNLTVCRAIEKLNREKGLCLEFVVIGLPYTDKEEIISHDFVTYYDSLPRQRVLEILQESYLYIQNSTFETFGLTVVEALMCNCNLLVSVNVGAIGVIETIEDGDLIADTNDVDEIAEKIEGVFLNGNAKRLRDGLEKNKVDCTAVVKMLLKKIEQIHRDK